MFTLHLAPRATTLHVRGQVLQVMFDGVIRTCQVNQIMFVGKDVATALGYSKPLNAISMHVDEDDKNHYPDSGDWFELHAAEVRSQGA